MTRKLLRAPLKLGIIAALPSLLLVTPPAASASMVDTRASNAVSFIQQAFDSSLASLDDASPRSSTGRQRFHQAVLNLIDARSAAYYTLGNFAAKASAGDVDAFVRAFREYTAACFEQQLGGDTHLSLTGLRFAVAGDVLVDAMLVRPHAEARTVTFRVRNASGGKPAVVDVRIDGIWMSKLRRADFTSFLSHNGGSVPRLTEQINKIAANIHASRQG